MQARKQRPDTRDDTDSLETGCDKDTVVVMTKNGTSTHVIVDYKVFEELEKAAANADFYKALWESERDMRDGKGLPLEEALAEYERLKEAYRAAYIAEQTAKPSSAL